MPPSPSVGAAHTSLVQTAGDLSSSMQHAHEACQKQSKHVNDITLLWKKRLLGNRFIALLENTFTDAVYTFVQNGFHPLLHLLHRENVYLAIKGKMNGPKGGISTWVGINEVPCEAHGSSKFRGPGKFHGCPCVAVIWRLHSGDTSCDLSR